MMVNAATAAVSQKILEVFMIFFCPSQRQIQWPSTNSPNKFQNYCSSFRPILRFVPYKYAYCASQEKQNIHLPCYIGLVGPSLLDLLVGGIEVNLYRWRLRQRSVLVMLLWRRSHLVQRPPPQIRVAGEPMPRASSL